MSQMNKGGSGGGGGNWKSATPKAVQPLKQARSNMVNAVNQANHAEKAVQNAGPGQHANAMKHLEYADKQSSGAQNQFMSAQKNAEKGRAMQGKAIGQDRKPQPMKLGNAPKGVGMNAAANNASKPTGIKAVIKKVTGKK